jgi:hypothetical protein
VSGARRTARNTTGDGWHSSYFLVLLIASSPVVRQQPARLFDGLRQSNRAKEILRIEVILAGFIDDPDETVLLGIGVAEGYADLPLLERSRIAIVIDAYD